MAGLGSYHHVSLSVTDLSRSETWYCEVFGLEVDRKIKGTGFERVRLRSRDGELTLSLTCHESGSGESFDERRTGLDHVAFGVGTVGDVEDLKRRFEQLGVDHSEIKGSAETAMVTLRDPDNIQLEVLAGGRLASRPSKQEQA